MIVTVVLDYNILLRINKKERLAGCAPNESTPNNTGLALDFVTVGERERVQINAACCGIDGLTGLS